MKLEQHEGLFFNRRTGEAIAAPIASDGKPVLVRTGWFFEDVTQELPLLGGDGEVKSVITTPIAPWNFPRLDSVTKLVKLILAKPNVTFRGVTYDDPNMQFPYSDKAPVILLDLVGDGTISRLAAGQLIRNICATVRADGGDNASWTIDNELDTLRRQSTRE